VTSNINDIMWLSLELSAAATRSSLSIEDTSRSPLVVAAAAVLWQCWRLRQPSVERQSIDNDERRESQHSVLQP